MADQVTPSGYQTPASYEKKKNGIPASPTYSSDTARGQNDLLGANDMDMVDMEKGHTKDKFHSLGWIKLTVVLIVEAIALGCLGLPKSFASLGMVAGVICSLGIGSLCIYTAWVVGEVKLKFPGVSHYADAGKLLAGRWGYEIISAMFVLQLVFLVGSHCLTGTIAFTHIIAKEGICTLAFGGVSAILLLIVALPPSFSEMAFLGYIDFVSILVAVIITMVATGIKSDQSVGGLGSSGWSAWPKPGLTFSEAFVAMSNIIFAYSFAICQFSFMEEMHTPTDYMKSVWALGIIEIIIYTLTGAIIYYFVGPEVQSPALLSGGTLMSRVAFGIAIPVIFISGSINTVVVVRYLHARIHKNAPEYIKRFQGFKGYGIWVVYVTITTIAAFIIAEAIPFFDDLLAISSSLFISGFSFYFPAMMWPKLIKEKGTSYFSKQNLPHTILNALCFIIGMIILVAGTYSSIKDIMDQYDSGSVRSPFACSPIG